MRTLAVLLCVSVCPFALAAAESAAKAEPEAKEKPGHLPRLVKKLLPTAPHEYAAMMVDPDNADRRRKGIQGLAKESWGRQEPYLKAYSLILETDSSPQVRSAAVRALGAAGDTTYLPSIVKALRRDGDASVRWDAACALDNVRGESAIEPLCGRAKSDSSVDVRISAIRALRHYRGERVKAALVECLASDDFSVRYQAHESLVAVTGRDHGYAPNKWLSSGETLADAAGAARAGAGAPRIAPGGRAETPRPAVETPPPAALAGSNTPAQPVGTPEPAAAPKAAPAAKRAPGAKENRPWWDWFGVTDKKKPAPKGSSAAQPKKPVVRRAPPPDKPKKPWWDLLGVTVKKKPKPAPQPRRVTKPKRPWWDWFGVTDKKKPQPKKE